MFAQAGTQSICRRGILCTARAHSANDLADFTGHRPNTTVHQNHHMPGPEAENVRCYGLQTWSKRRGNHIPNSRSGCQKGPNLRTAHEAPPHLSRTAPLAHTQAHVTHMSSSEVIHSTSPSLPHALTQQNFLGHMCRPIHWHSCTMAVHYNEQQHPVLALDKGVLAKEMHLRQCHNRWCGMKHKTAKAQRTVKQITPVHTKHAYK